MNVPLRMSRNCDPLAQPLWGKFRNGAGKLTFADHVASAKV